MINNKLNILVISSIILLAGSGCDLQNNNATINTKNIIQESNLILNQLDDYNKNKALKKENNKIVNYQAQTDNKEENKINTEIDPLPIKLDGTVVKFINKITGEVVPGHTIYCNGCKNSDFRTGQETDINGEVALTPEKNDSEMFVSPLKSDWNNYEMTESIKNGNKITIEMTPYKIAENQRIFFPKATYQKNNDRSTKITITYKNLKGQPQKEVFLNLTGTAMPDQNSRDIVRLFTNNESTATATLPKNGPYRFSIDIDYKTTYFQFDAPTGHTTFIDLDLSKLNTIPEGTSILSTKVTNAISVCTRDKKTNKPISAPIVMTNTTQSFTAPIKYKEEHCVYVPKSYENEKVFIPTSPYYSASEEKVIKDNVNEDGVIYLYTEKLK